jgi:membrane-bound metal-dependent hydrolase YbcI (DUF457 family)
MPLTILHAGVGAAAGAAAYAIECAVADRPVDNDTLGQTALLGAVAGALPDILEPPTDRFHRKFFHSFATLGCTALLYNTIHDSEKIDSGHKAVTKSLITAYMTHLLLDSRTPMGLPIV